MGQNREKVERARERARDKGTERIAINDKALLPYVPLFFSQFLLCSVLPAHKQSDHTHLDLEKAVSVPLLDHVVLANAKDVMCVAGKANGRHCVLVRQERLVAVAKIQTPDLNILVGRAGKDRERRGGGQREKRKRRLSI